VDGGPKRSSIRHGRWARRSQSIPDARQQGARSLRSPFPLLGVIQSNRYVIHPQSVDSTASRSLWTLGLGAGRHSRLWSWPILYRVDVSRTGCRSRRAPLRSLSQPARSPSRRCSRAVPGLRRRREAARQGGNGAGAVPTRPTRSRCSCFLEEPHHVRQIADIIERVVSAGRPGDARSLEDVLAADAEARQPGAGSRMPLTILVRSSSYLALLIFGARVRPFHSSPKRSASGAAILPGVRTPVDLVAPRRDGVLDLVEFRWAATSRGLGSKKREWWASWKAEGRGLDRSRALRSIRMPLWARMAVNSRGRHDELSVLAFRHLHRPRAISGVPARATTQVDTVLTSALRGAPEALGPPAFRGDPHHPGERRHRSRGTDLAGAIC